ncbi:MAG: carbohydrate kinase family protein [Steroidobacteraceae bacterium]
MKIWDVTVVGEIYIDHVMSGFETWPAPGEEVTTEHYTREIGGGCATTACGLSRLGKSVNLVGIIGEDDAPWLERRLVDFGITGQGLRRISGPTGVTLSVSTREDRSFFTHVGVNRRLSQELMAPETLVSLTRARHIHFAMPLSRPLAAMILPALGATGCTSSLDLGYQPAWLTDEGNHATCQAVDYLLPNEKEAALLSGGETPADYFAFARKLRMRSGILKLGARGAMSAGAGGAVITVSPPKVVAIDSTGSGDAFAAGFIDALLEGANEEERLRRACICGALSTRVPGALGGLPNREELWSIYEQTYGS